MTVKSRQESIGWREGGGIGKGPRDGNQTRIAVSTDVLYVDALTTRLSVPMITYKNLTEKLMHTFRKKGFIKVNMPIKGSNQFKLTGKD